MILILYNQLTHSSVITRDERVADVRNKEGFIVHHRHGDKFGRIAKFTVLLSYGMSDNSHKSVKL